jgi:Delta7-sterol 5-desaturase
LYRRRLCVPEIIAFREVVNETLTNHLYFNFDFGQYTTLWDRVGGSYRKPNDELFKRETKMGKQEWERQTKEMERLVKEVEGDDDQEYGGEVRSLQKKVQ